MEVKKESSEPIIIKITLSEPYYSMIESGIKDEEYRVIKDYWLNRFRKKFEQTLCGKWIIPPNTFIEFYNGGHFHPSIKHMQVQLIGLSEGIGKLEWGAEPNVEYFVLKLTNVKPNYPIYGVQ